MVALSPQSDESLQTSSPSPLSLFPTTPKIPCNDLFTLITDFFDWLEMDWQLPLLAKARPRELLPHPLDLHVGLHTVPDLVELYGRSVHTVHQFLWKHRIPSAGTRPTGKGGGHYTLYHKQDLLPVIEQWEWERLMNAVDIWWLRFFPVACGTCQRCRSHAHQVVTQQIHCSGSVPLAHYPLHADVRIGHVALDDIRHYFWQYAATQPQPQSLYKGCWDKGPRHFRQGIIGTIEQALAAPVYDGKKGILSRRPETERKIISPYRIVYEGKMNNAGYQLLPPEVQKDMMTYFIYCHQEQRMALTTLRTHCLTLMQFFTWARIQGKLADYPHWGRKVAHEIFRAYASHGCSEVQAATRRERLFEMAHFFTTLSNLEFPVPEGYRLLYTLEKSTADAGSPRTLPKEEIIDRVFQDGVRQLSYDPFSRLALTIQYYCGTRVTETCELHVFCILEDRDGHAYLLIPLGKTKQERPFPIVELGMGPLLEYMDEIIALRLTPEGTSHLLGKTNFRYLENDPEKAKDWHYLFDRIPGAGGMVRRRGRLSRHRVNLAMQEALLIAAKTNSNDLFQMATYHPTCQHRRRKGQKCFYFAAEAGITTCPCCGSSLSGKLGVRCSHLLETDLICDGVTHQEEMFCPKCDLSLADFQPITTHIFRHNSVSRAHRAGVSLTQNMRLHGHQTVPMHLRYLHLLLEDTTNEVRQIFAEKRLRDVRQALGTTSGKIVEGGIAYTVSLEHYLGITLQRSLKRRTYGIWGGFWAGALAQRGIASPLSVEDEIVIPEDTYEHTVAQYWYEALGLAVSEVAFEYITKGKWHAEVPLFLDRNKIETLVQFHLHQIQDSFKSALGQRLMETDILEQRRFLDDLAEKLRPWWQHLGAIDQLVEMFAPGGAMRSTNSYRPQNQHPDGLVASRKQVAEQHYQQVRVTIQAMQRRGMKPQDITVPAIAKEAGVSVATIYRRTDLFTLVQRANPAIQRRQTEQVYQKTIQQLQEEVEKARSDAEYYQKEAQFAKQGERRTPQDVIQLKKTLLALQRQVTCLEEMLARCTCGAHTHTPPRSF